MKRLKHVVVDCVKNDSVDIKCGGPQYLGFDFFVSIKDSRTIDKFIESELTKNKKPCLNIWISPKAELRPNGHMWTKSRISRCIKREEF